MSPDAGGSVREGASVYDERARTRDGYFGGSHEQAGSRVARLTRRLRNALLCLRLANLTKLLDNPRIFPLHTGPNLSH